MENLEEQKEKIITRLKEINEKLTDDVLKKATKEEMEQYLELTDEIILKLTEIDMLKNNK